jgi:hypothetical protein
MMAAPPRAAYSFHRARNFDTGLVIDVVSIVDRELSF